MMNNKFKVAFALLLVGAFSNSFSQSSNFVSVKTKLDKDTILLGDQIYYTLTVNGQKEVKLQLPVVADSLGNGLDLVSRPTVDSIVTSKDVTITIKYLITAFDSGMHAIPTMPIVATLNGKTDSIFVSGSSLFVKMLPKDPKQTDIYDVKPPIREPITFAEIAPWVGSGLILAALIFLLALYLKNRKRNKPFLNFFKPADPAHVVALRELHHMLQDKQWNTENHKHYYTRLVDILREYLEGRFNINAPEQTSSEILSEINKIDYSFNGLKNQLQELLFMADLVKFAKHTPLINENEQFLNFAIDFVNKTKPEEVVPESATESSAQESIDNPKNLN